MDTYIRGIRNTNDQIVLFFISIKCSRTGLALSTSVFCAFSLVSDEPAAGDAPYPACTTASIIPCSFRISSSYSTCILLVRRLTLTSFTPSSLRTHFSTLEEQDEQVMPVTSNFSFIFTLPLYMIFPNIVTSSSTFSSLSSSVLALVTQLFK